MRTLGSVPGENVDPQTAWIGGAGKTIATLQADLLSQQQKQERMNQEMLRELQLLRQSKSAAEPAQPLSAAPETTSQASLEGEPNRNRVAAGGTVKGETLPGPGAGLGLPNPRQQGATGNAYPPGQPLGADAQPGGADASAAPPLGIVKVSIGARSNNGKDAAAPTAGNTKEPRHVETFLPVSFTRAVLLGGMDAPTGGQAQHDSMPVFFKLIDNAFLPNEYRSAVKDCLVVAEGFGSVSAERAYIRTLLLSCVLKNGQALEVPIKGTVFGEDGKNGMRGRMVTKQGAILTNALLSGIASGMGQGFASSAQTISVSPLGATGTPGTSTPDILKSGLGTGVGRAMDRLAQYYINLAERTFPVIEVDAGRMVDIVITQGVTLNGAVAVTADGSIPTNSRNIHRGALMNAVNEDSDD